MGEQPNRDRRPCITYDRAVAPGADPRIIAIAAGDPFDLKTWSGSSHWLLSALRRRGVLEEAVDVWPAGADVVARLGSWNRDRLRWRQRYWAQASPLDGAIRALVGATGTRRIRAVNASPDVVLQVGASRFDGPRLRARLRCSFSDTHLALFLTRPDNLLDASSRLVRKALDRERRAFESLDVIFTMSDWMRESIIADAGQDPEKVVTVGTGANIVIPTAAPRRAPAPPRFLFVGMRFERKGGSYLLDAFALVRWERPDAELWIVGPETPTREQEGVRWFGRIDRRDPAGEAEITRLYTEATAFVMPSIFEPAGIVFLEAMAFALPCVGSDCCAMPEFIARDESGLLTRRADAEDLAAQLLTLASAPERARQMGLEGFRRLSERFTWDHVAGRMVRELRTRLDRR
jgi:starch synthase